MSRNVSAAATTARGTLLPQELVFRGSVSLAVRLDRTELPTGSDSSLGCYYLQAPRNSYLPLLLPDMRRHLIEVVLDETSAAAITDDMLWLEAANGGEPWKWHWPVGLLYDYFLASFPNTNLNLPLELILHITNRPDDKLPIGPSIDSCKSNFMNMVKEADYARWGTTRKVTSLRRAEQDALWEGVIERDFEKFWSVACKLVPGPASPGVNVPDASAMPGEARSNDVPVVRSVPFRLYLPGGAPVMQDSLAPFTKEGRPMTLYDALSLLIPLIFPPRATDMTTSMLTARPLGQAIIQGVILPLNTELGWLGALMAGADGWIGCVVKPSR